MEAGTILKDNTPLSSSVQSAEIDSLAQKDYMLSAEVLMEVAGALSAREIYLDVKTYRKSTSTIMILCGPGNNGGDGLVTARHLLSEGVSVEVFCPQSVLSKTGKRNDIITKQRDRLKALEIPIHSLEKMEDIKKIGAKCSLIVDALFGVGLDRNIEGVYTDLIQWINSSGKRVVALDTPSGLNVDTGRIRGQAVKAHLTFSFGLAKPGFYLMDGPGHTGQLKVFSIGFPLSLLRKRACTHFLIEESWVSARLPDRRPTDHKACQGHLLVLAGSEGFWGAGQLTALSSYRMGVGYVTTSNPFINQNIPDVLTQSLSDPKLFEKKTAVAIGPGLGTGESTKKLLVSLKKTRLPVVVDADAFTVCVKDNLFPLPSHWVLTPHSGELARMFGIKGKTVDQDRCFYAMKASRKAGCLVLLKGFYSVLAGSDKCWIIPKGGSALAKAGTGDVLTGFIGALMARSLSAFTAGAVAGFIHGLLAEKWVSSGKDADSLMAQDLKDILPLVLKKLRSFHHLPE